MPPVFLPQAVIFDWDNTLVENWQALTGAMNEALIQFGLPPWDQAQMVANSKQSLRNSFPTIFGRHWEKARDIFYAHFRANHLDGLHPLDQAEAVLRLLRNHGVRLALCSNKNGDILRREVRHAGWTRCFSSAIGAQDAVRDKPDAAPVQLILKTHQLTAGSHIWFVGDTVTDMMTARHSGCYAVGIGADAMENEAFRPDLHVLDLGELFAKLGQVLSLSPSLS